MWIQSNIKRDLYQQSLPVSSRITVWKCFVCKVCKMFIHCFYNNPNMMDLPFRAIYILTLICIHGLWNYRIYKVYCDEINVWLALYTVCNRFIFCSTYEWWVFMFSYFFCVQLYWNVFQFPNYMIKAHSPWLDIIFLMKWKSIVNKLYFSCFL